MLASVTRIVLERLAEGPARSWLERSLDATSVAAFAAAFAVAPRKVGQAPVEAASLGWLGSGATIDELARVVLFARAVAMGSSDEGSAIAHEWYRQGDNGEKRAVLRALSLLPSPERFVEVGAGACRTSVQSVFEAICCENPFPAAHFSDLAFNQMVLKALFTGVALERIERLDDRTNPELARMASDYASERRAAGRSVPADIGRVGGLR